MKLSCPELRLSLKSKMVRASLLPFCQQNKFVLVTKWKDFSDKISKFCWQTDLHRNFGSKTSRRSCYFQGEKLLFSRVQGVIFKAPWRIPLILGPAMKLNYQTIMPTRHLWSLLFPCLWREATTVLFQPAGTHSAVCTRAAAGKPLRGIFHLLHSTLSPALLPSLLPPNIPP